MFARASTFRGGFGRLEAGIELFRDEVVPEVEQQPGFAGAFLLADRDADAIYAVTLWDTMEALRASDERGKRLAEQAASQLGLHVRIRYPEVPVFVGASVV